MARSLIIGFSHCFLSLTACVRACVQAAAPCSRCWMAARTARLPSPDPVSATRTHNASKCPSKQAGLALICFLSLSFVIVLHFCCGLLLLLNSVLIFRNFDPANEYKFDPRCQHYAETTTKGNKYAINLYFVEQEGMWWH